MNINQNIVRIMTSTQIGSGIIYPCETCKEYEYKPLYIIFTNRHLVKDLPDISDECKLKKMVEFDIYDQTGKLVEMDLISNIKLFVGQDLSKKDSEESGEGIEDLMGLEDIAAFLISFEFGIKMDLETKLMWDDKKLNTIYVEGFPRVLYDNEISSKIQMQGKYKKVFPENSKFGVFQITDDYHWYSNFKDLKLFQGFSGGPVYNMEENSHFIVGLNQSVLNINEGENPFKLLYFYKIKYVLEYLREKGCIIFRRNEDYSVNVRWIYERNKEKNKGS